MTERACDFCGAPFTPRRKDARFDSPLCKQRFYRRQERKKAHARSRELRDCASPLCDVRYAPLVKSPIGFCRPHCSKVAAALERGEEPPDEQSADERKRPRLFGKNPHLRPSPTPRPDTGEREPVPSDPPEKIYV